MTQHHKTYEAVEHLLNLLRCDHCNAALHQPYTTGVCDHLICATCRLERNTKKKATCCPVCAIPVHHRDFQLHPQVAQLVLVARRLKKLTVDLNSPLTSPEKLIPSITHKPSHPVDEVASFKEPLQPAPNIQPCIGSRNRSLQPSVVLKRGYSTSSSVKSLSEETNNAPSVTLKRSYSIDPDVSESFDTHSLPINRYSTGSASILSRAISEVGTMAVATAQTSRPRRLRHVKNRSVSMEQPVGGSVTRLAAYPRGSCESLLKEAVSTSVEHECTTDGDSMDLVLRAASHVHQTRSSMRRSVCSDLTSVTSNVPIASPENTNLTDLPSTSPPNPAKTLPNALSELPPIPRVKLESIIDRASIRIRGTKSRIHSDMPEKAPKAAERKSTNKQASRSSGLARIVQKLRPNSKGESLLHRAAIRGQLGQVRECLSSGMSPDLRDHAGWTPLHEAVLHGHRDVAEALLVAGATVNIPGGPELDMPLHDAIQNAQVACSELLLHHGASPTVANGAGLTPLQLVDACMARAAAPSPKASKRKISGSADRRQTGLLDALQSIRANLLKAVSQLSAQSALSAKNEPGQSKESRVMPQMAQLSTFVERRRLHPVLLATGLNRQQQATFARVAHMIHAQIVSVVSPDVTHVITGASQESTDSNVKQQRRGEQNAGETLCKAHCSRTLKFLNAVLLGCWILSFDWIETCAHVKMRVEEEGFEITGCSTTPLSGAPRRARLAREAGSLGLFHGLRFCLLGEFSYPVPSSDELATLARSGGGVVVSCRKKCSHLRLARLAVQAADENNSASTTSDWILDPTTEQSDAEVDAMDEDDRYAIEANRAGPIPLCLAGQTSQSPLLVIYDQGTGRASREATTASVDCVNTTPPYAIQMVSKARGMLQPRIDRTGEFSYPVPSSDELATLARSGGGVVVSCRKKCSHLRLARLAVQAADENNSASTTSDWILDPTTEQSDAEVDAMDEDDRYAIEANRAGPIPLCLAGQTSQSPLLVIYDQGTGRASREATTASVDCVNTTPPYAIQMVSKARGMLQPRIDRTVTTSAHDIPPIQAVPAAWLLDCAAEYAVLPLSVF